MARRTPSKTNTSKSRALPREKSFAELARADVDAKIERARARRNAERRAARVPKELERPASAAERRELKEHGFRTTSRGVIVDGPRDKRRNPIKGARVTVQRGGIVKTSVGARRDFIYGFTRKEKKEFARNPEAFTKKKMSELERLLPSLRKVKKKQVRLQWGAYQAQKDFAPSYFTAKYFAAISPEETRRVGKKRAKPRADKLTGLHIVIHIPKRSKARNRVRDNAKGKGRKRR